MEFEKTFQIRVRCFPLSLEFRSLSRLAKHEGSALDPSPRPGVSFTKKWANCGLFVRRNPLVFICDIMAFSSLLQSAHISTRVPSQEVDV